jgi:hypothetical protein
MEDTVKIVKGMEWINMAQERNERSNESLGFVHGRKYMNGFCFLKK